MDQRPTNGAGARAPHRSSVIVVAAGSRLGWGRLAVLAAVLGFCVNVVMRFVFVGVQDASDLEGWVYLVVVAFLVGIPIPLLYRRLRPRTVVPFAILYTVAAFVWHVVCLIVNGLYADAYGAPFPLFARSGMLPMFFGDWYVTGVVLVGTLSAWVLCRWKYGPIIEQDGTICPNCGYSLLGCTHQVCSECGREFTLQELGTTVECFESVKRVQGRVARPLR